MPALLSMESLQTDPFAARPVALNWWQRFKMSCCSCFDSQYEKKERLYSILMSDNPNDVYQFDDYNSVEDNVPLSIACQMHQNSLVIKLLNRGADPEYRYFCRLNGYERSPFYDAVVKGNEEAVILLLKHGALVNGHSNNFPATKNIDAPALINALHARQKKLYATLLFYGADINLKNWSREGISISRKIERSGDKKEFIKAVECARRRLVQLLSCKVRPADPKKPFVALNKDVARCIASYCYISH